MTARQPKIAPCPCGCPGGYVWEDGEWFRVQCPRWRGEWKKSERAAILAWNRRDTAEAERRGAEACVRWIEDAGLSVISKDLRRAFERGEVLPGAKAKKGAKRT